MQEHADFKTLSFEEMVANYDFDGISAAEIINDKISDIAKDIGCSCDDLAFLSVSIQSVDDLQMPLFRDVLLAAE